MANNQDLAQIDYAFNNYYGRYIAPIVEKEYASLVKKQNKEYLDAITPKGVLGVISSGNLENQIVAGREVLKNGKWNSQSISTVVDKSLDKVSKNKVLSNDWYVLAVQWDLALQKQLGQAKYSELQKKCGGRPGDYYMGERLINLMSEQLGRKGAPKTATGRIIRKGMQLSLFGMVHDATNWFMTPNRKAVSAYDQRVKTYHNRASDPKSRGERWASYAAASLIDVGTTGLGGGVKSAATSLGVGAATLGGMEYGMTRVFGGEHGISYDQGSQYVMNYAYGSSDAADKAWTAANKKYRTHGSLLLLQTNTMLHKKVKVGGLGLNDRANLLCNKMLSKNRSSINLWHSIGKSFDSQAIHYNSHAKVPQWMNGMSERQCRSFGSKFYSIAMELSRSRKESVVVCGRKMTLNEVAQRAYDYSHAAAIKREAINAQIARSEQRRAAFAAVQQSQSSGASHHHSKQQHVQSTVTPQQAASNLYNHQNISGQPDEEGQVNSIGEATQQGQPAQQGMGYQPPSMGGWDNAMKQMGLSDFGDTWQNIGYVLAMLPDMLIGMFTGKNKNFKLENNYMPLAAIIAGMFFTKNSFLKMLLLGLGGANLLNNANHAMKNDGQGNKPVRQLKSYPDEPLNSRIKNPVIKGRSLLGTFDGKPLCITINSNETIYAYEKGALPLNTLANAILADMDKQQASASASYDRSIAEAEERPRAVGIK